MRARQIRLGKATWTVRLCSDAAPPYPQWTGEPHWGPLAISTSPVSPSACLLALPFPSNFICTDATFLSCIQHFKYFRGGGFLVVYTARNRSDWIALQKVLNLFWVRKVKEAGSTPAGILNSQTCPSISLFPAAPVRRG